ncbi:MAG: hypothetical protein KGH67_05845 [Candidatus Micrarchaeota archaeon]|nr:hypothetical protein [Candidatus Micrarchaeota archaeon]
MAEQTDEYKKLRRYAEAIVFFIEHPEATDDTAVKAMVTAIKKQLEPGQKQLKISQLAT